MSLSSISPTSLSVMIDPGHGGMDQGAVYGKSIESELVLQVSKKLLKKLNETDIIKADMTRWTDRMISLQSRVEKAKEKKVDLFISLHANASSDQRAKGLEFFLQNSIPMDEDLMQLARQENQISQERLEEDLPKDPSKKNDLLGILKDLQRQHKIRSSLALNTLLASEWPGNKHVKQAPFYVVNHPPMPSVLIELGFLSNPREASLLSSAQYQDILVEKIYSALMKYKEKVDNPPLTNLNEGVL